MTTKNKVIIILVIIALVLGGWTWWSNRRSENSEGTEERVSFFSGSEEVANDEGAVSSGYEYEEEAEQVMEAQTFMNEFLGIKYTVPAGWWIYEQNEMNFSKEVGKTGDESLLDVYESDEVVYLDLMSVGNQQYSTAYNHIGVDLSVEQFKELNSLAEYMTAFEDYMLEEDLENERYYELKESGVVEIGGKNFEKRIFEVQQGETTDDNYYILSLTTAVGDNYYLTISSNFWPEMKNAESIVVDNLTSNLIIE